MPLFLLPAVPAAVAWLGSALVAVRAGIGAAAVYEMYPIAREKIAKRWDELAPSIMQFAMDKYGLNMDISKGINDETLTAVINEKLLGGTGLSLDSVLNKDRAKNGLKRLAIQQVTNRLGLPGVTTLAGARAALQDWLTAEVGAQLAAEAGDLIDVAAGRAILAAKIAAVQTPKVNWNTPQDFSNKGVKNRQRQAKYRANHKKHWETR